MDLLSSQNLYINYDNTLLNQNKNDFWEPPAFDLINIKNKYKILLCIEKKKVPAEIIELLFKKWKIGEYIFVCDNIYCSKFMMAEEKNFMVKKDKIYSICSDNCDIHFNIQYILENNIHYEEKVYLDDLIYDFICHLSENEKNKFHILYPVYFDDFFN